jgi:hypothetical protein
MRLLAKPVKPQLTANGKALKATVKQGRGIKPLRGGELQDDATQITIPVDAIIGTAEHICIDQDCQCMDGDRCRCSSTSVHLSTGEWVTIQGKHADVDEMLGF